MNKYIPYIIATVIGGAILALVLTGGRGKKKKVFDQRITLRKQDKIPYGTYAAYRLLKNMVPEGKIMPSRQEPGYWDSVDAETGKLAYLFIGHRFTADKYEMNNLASFAEKGNDVFVSSSYLSTDADEFIKCNSSSLNSEFVDIPEFNDSLITFLETPFVTGKKLYSYPGLTFGSYFTDVDTSVADVLGTNKNGKPNFIHLAIGKGHLYFHLEPLAFSNYFILYKNNIDYFEKVISVIHPQTKRVIWDDYYATKRQENNSNTNNGRQGWFKTLMNIENDEGKRSFQWAFWLLLLLLLLYVLMEMRRKQRYIPVIKSPKNDSLDFVKTIGRLYYDKGNHANLCRKMAAYFLEHVRASYKIPTNQLDDKFVTQLQYKSGAAEHEIRSIVSFIKFMEDGGAITKEHLLIFHNELEQFYQKA